MCMNSAKNYALTIHKSSILASFLMNNIDNLL